jgi:outer membrane protein assembly factor BamB
MQKLISLSLFGLITTSLLMPKVGYGANWAQWRGPHFNGSTTEQNLPESWSKTENVAWIADLPGPAGAVPVIWEDRVFVSTTDKQAKSIHALCLDRKTGKILWQEKIADAFARDNMSNFASPSPATDGKLVVFLYGNGDLVTFDVGGKKLWSQNLQKEYGDFCFQWTYAASPLLYDGKLYIQVLQRNVPVHGKGRTDGPNESYLLALEPATGKTLWRHIRPSDAKAESLEAFTTPMPFEFNGRKELLIAGGDCLTGHDPATGRELWRWGTWNPSKIGHWRLVPSPVAGDGIILVCAPKKDPVYAIKAGGSGNLGDAGLAWNSEQARVVSSDVPTPAFYDRDFFVLGDGHKALSRVEPKTGKVKWSIDLPGSKKFEASPTAGDGKLYLLNFAGEVLVVDTDDGKILRTIPMGEEGDDKTRSTIAVSQGQLFIRTNSKLFCIGKKT